jgi:hypothetical protein
MRTPTILLPAPAVAGPLACIIFVLMFTVHAFAQGSAGAAPQPAVSADPRSARMLVLDASGSMWKHVHEDNARSPRRAELAAQFVDTFTARLAAEPNQRTLGMVRLGYKYPWIDPSISLDTKCKDVELIASPDTTAAQARRKIAHESGVGRKVLDDDYNPKGQTPLTLALEQAANAAPPGGATLVVVTDLEKDDKCGPDPCADDNKPIAALAKLFESRKIRIRYVIAAGLIGAIGERAKQFAACFDAEFRVLENLDQARQLGTEVGRRLSDEAVASRTPPARGSIAVVLQDANGRELKPTDSQVDVRLPHGTTSLLRSSGVVAVDPGRYETTLQVGTRRWQIEDVEVASSQKTEVMFIIAHAILQIDLIDSDYMTIDDQPDTVWEIAPNPANPSLPTLSVKGTRLNQTLPAGAYRIKIYTQTGEVSRDVTLEPGGTLKLKERGR